MNDVLVLCYHAVSPTWQNPLAVTPESLEAQLSGLIRRGWRPSTFTDAVLRPPHARTLVVTFDDGFLSVLTRALPVLSHVGIPATVFVPTGFMSERRSLCWPGIEHWMATPFAPELEGMCWADLRSLTALGWEIGSHTCTHPYLTRLDERSARAELEQSRLDCEQQLGGPCTSIAYPYGDVDARIADAARFAGYRAAACLSSRLTPGGALRWPRVGVYHHDDLWRFRMKTNTALRRIRASRLWPANR